MNIQKAIENGPVEIVDFPIENKVIFHCYVAVHLRVMAIFNDHGEECKWRRMEEMLMLWGLTIFK